MSWKTKKPALCCIFDHIKRTPFTLGYAEALVMAYNSKNKHRLMMQKLYWNGKKKSSPDDVMEYDEAQ